MAEDWDTQISSGSGWTTEEKPFDLNNNPQKEESKKSYGFGASNFGEARNNDNNDNNDGGKGFGAFKPRNGNDYNGGFNKSRDRSRGDHKNNFQNRDQSSGGYNNKNRFQNRNENNRSSEGLNFRRNDRRNETNDNNDNSNGSKGFGSAFRPRQDDTKQYETKTFTNRFNNNSRNNENEDENKPSFSNRFGNNSRRNENEGENKPSFSNRFSNNSRNNENEGENKPSFSNRFGNNSRRNENEDENKPSFSNRFSNNSRRNENEDDSKPSRGFSSSRVRRNETNENEDNNAKSTFGQRQRNNVDSEEPNTDQKERYIPEPLDDNEDTLFHTTKTGINFKKQAELEANLSGADSDTIQPIEKFKDLNLSDLLFENIEKSKYEIPTPVQKYAIPIILKRRDLMACAQTGSGKTASYLIPIMTNILHDGIETSEFSATQMPQSLILSPTRELAIQIFNECRKFSYKSMIKCQILYGGTVTSYQINELSRGTNILVATPGRLLDVINKGKLSLDKLKYVVLDEADRMLDSGFEQSVREILSKCTVNKSDLCIFMFSATFPKEIQKLAQDFLKNYLFLTIGIVGGANTDIEQIIYQVERFKKREKLLEILNEIGNERIMIFVEQKKLADVLALFLSQKSYPTTSIHGDRLQSQRELALKTFKKGEHKIIVCTQVAARGLDISDVNHVINYDLPATIDEYVHRIGRTGRCGNIGKAISFFDATNENNCKLARNLVRILMQANKPVPDWLNKVAEDSFGSTFDDNKCVSDLRNEFKSLSTNNEFVSTINGNNDSDEVWG